MACGRQRGLVRASWRMGRRLCPSETGFGPGGRVRISERLPGVSEAVSAAAEEMELDELEQEAAAGLAALLADEAFDDDFDDDEDPEASAEELIGGAAPAAAVAARPSRQHRK